MAENLFAVTDGLDLAEPVAGANLFAEAKTAQPGSFARGWRTGTAGLRAAGQGLKALGASAIGAPQAEGEALAASRQALEEVAPDVMRVEDVNSIGSGFEFAKYAIGTALPSILMMAGGGVGGKIAGSLIARRLASEATKKAVSNAGLIGGAGAASVGLETGGIYPEAVEEGVANPGLRSVAGGVAAGALDVAPFAYLTRTLGLLGDVAKATRKPGLGAIAKGAGVEGVKTALFEGITEAAQEAIARTAAGKPLDTPEALSEYANAAAIGAIAGKVAGTAVGTVSTLQRPIAVEDTQTGTDPTQTENVQVDPRVAALQAELALPFEQRRPKEDILREMRNLGAAPDNVVTASPVQGTVIGDQPVVDTSANDLALIQQKRDAGVLLDAREAKILRDADKARPTPAPVEPVEQRTPRSRQVLPTQGRQDEVLEGLAVESVQKNIAELVEAGAFRKGAATKAPDTLIAAVREAAKAPSLEQAQKQVRSAVLTSLRGKVNKKDAETFAAGVVADLERAPTLYSKSAVQPAPSIPGRRVEDTGGSQRVATVDRRQNLAGRVDKAAQLLQDAQTKSEAIGSQLAVAVSRGEKAESAKLTPQWKAAREEVSKRTTELAAAREQLEIYRTYAEQLSLAAQLQAAEHRDTLLRIKGQQVISEIRKMVGNDPNLDIRGYFAEPGEPVGRYTRTSPIKSTIEFSLNAKDMLSVGAHEGYHYLEDRILPDRDLAIITRALKPGRPMFQEVIARTRAYDAANRTSIMDEVISKPEEARAYAYEFWKRGELKADRVLATIWQKIRNFAERIKNLIDGLGFTSIEDIFEAIERGAYAGMSLREGVGVRDQLSTEDISTWYYSALAQQVNSLPTNAASAQGWKDTLKGLVNKGLIKQAELEAVGVPEWLDARKGKITKRELLDFIGANGVQVQEVVLDNGGSDLSEVEAWWNDEGGANEEKPFAELTPTERQSALVRYQEDVGAYSEGATKFSQYQLPGGENYRELLLTLPGRDSEADAARERRMNELLTRIEGYELEAKDAQHQGDTAALETARKNIRNTRVQIGLVEKEGFKTFFKSSHFDQPNILAHIRFNERTDADGKRVLFIEEIQSDWAQKGKKEGFTGDRPADATVLPAGVEITEFDNSTGHYYQAVWSSESGREGAAGLPGVNRQQAVNGAWERNGQYEGIPSAPFVTKTEAWVGLSLKRMIRYAAENGFDRIAWTTGEQQAARYDLSKQLSTLTIRFTSEHFDTHVLISGSDTTGAPFYKGPVTLGELADVIGKDLAEKAQRGLKDKREVTLSGLDLKVGGEGMKAFYDKIVPNVANDILKRLGGGKTGIVDLATDAAPGPQGSVGHQPGFDITPTLRDKVLVDGQPLFSRAAQLDPVAVASALTSLDARFQRGEMAEEQFRLAAARLLDHSKLSDASYKDLFGVIGEALSGGVTRGWVRNFSTKNYISTLSEGFKNVQKTLRNYVQRKDSLVAANTLVALSEWHAPKGQFFGGPTREDTSAVGTVMFERTVAGLREGSPEYLELTSKLSPKQLRMLNQANKMIGTMLDAELESDRLTWSRLFQPEELEAHVKARSLRVQELKDSGYVPERRYGDHVAHVYMDTIDPKGNPVRLTVKYEFYPTFAEAKLAADSYRGFAEATGAEFKVEAGHRHKLAASRDTTISLQQFLDTAERNGIQMGQTSRERIARALLDADSARFNRIMHRKNIPGFSQDIMRVLHEFAITLSRKIAYSEYSEAIKKAQAGARVDAYLEDGKPQIKIAEPSNLWPQDNEEQGFYRSLADEMVNDVLAPDQSGTWSSRLKGAAMVYFLGGSLASGAVNMMSVPMNLAPWLTLNTSYTNAMSTTFSTWQSVLRNSAQLRDINVLKDPNAAIPAIDSVEGLRKALITAAEDGTTSDTEIHQVMGISQGGLFAQSTGVRKAMEAWMLPFRFAEQTNRITAFIAGYKVGQSNKLTGRALYEYAQGAVDNTQNRYDEVNRPRIAGHPVWSLMFMFKSFPIFVIEMMTIMHRQNPRSTVYFMLGLVALTGINGFPFAETIYNLVDTLSQRLFGSPFNSRKALRGMIKDMSEAMIGVDASELVLRGAVNTALNLSISSRIGLGDFVPGTRLGAADSDFNRVATDILGAPFAMGADILTGAGKAIDTAFGPGPMSAEGFASAAKEGLPLAARNVVKGYQQFTEGYAADAKGRKLQDVSGLDALWQSIGFTSGALTRAYEVDRIDKQDKAFYVKVRDGFIDSMVQAVRAGDTEKAQEIINFVEAWNASYPDMPIGFNAATMRRRVVESGLVLNERTLRNLPRALRGTSLAAEGAVNP